MVKSNVRQVSDVFQQGRLIQIEGIIFRVAFITKDGLQLRYVGEAKPKIEGED